MGVCFRRELRSHHVTGDAKYGTTENIVAIEHAAIRAYIPLPDFGHRTALYSQDKPIYDAERDQCRCPEGQPLPRYRAKHAEEVVVYRAETTTCNACLVRTACGSLQTGLRPGAVTKWSASEREGGSHERRAVWL